jgi:uncharacterized damage-inducible protein DinB
MMKNVLLKLFGYHAWANSDLLSKLKEIDAAANAADLETTLRLMNHYHVIARIFSANLTGAPHGYTSDNTDETPSLSALAEALSTVDQWYLNYLNGVTEEQLGETVPFTFTDGDKGLMTREEMLTHVAVHAGYHRAEIGRILWNLRIAPPWDPYAVYLHRTQPDRREQNVG